jgi:hypothetical protein
VSFAREKDGYDDQDEKESSTNGDANYSTCLESETGCKVLKKVIITFSHKEKVTYPVICGASVLKAPVSTLLTVTVWSTADVLVEVIVGVSSGILLNDIAMVGHNLVNQDEEKYKNNSNLRWRDTDWQLM